MAQDPGRGGRRNRGRGPNQQLRDAPRRKLALELRKAGLTYDEIAAKLKLRHRASAEKLVKRALAELWQEPAEELIKLEVERLDRMLAGLTREASYDDEGNLLAGGAFDGEPRAVLAAIKLMDRRAKLLGLDRPQKLEHTGKDGAPLIDVAALTDEQLRALTAGIAAPAGGGGTGAPAAPSASQPAAPGAAADPEVAAADTAGPGGPPDRDGGGGADSGAR